jgi:hypothetical protein
MIWARPRGGERPRVNGIAATPIPPIGSIDRLFEQMRILGER